MPVDRDAIVARALALVGLSYGATRDRYVDALYPHDVRGVALSMAGSQSSCGLTCEAILRTVGIESLEPYAASLRGARLPAVVWQREEAKRRGAWVDATTWDESRQLPIMGDMVEIGGGGHGWSDPGVYAGSHVLTLVCGERYGCDSVDGGQSDPQNSARPTAIGRRARRFDERGRQLWLVDTDGRGRRVAGWIDVSRL